MLKAWKLLMLIFALLLTKISLAEKVQEGKISLKGSIYSSACNISNGSQDQTIDFGRIAARREYRSGNSSRIFNSQKSFTLILENCDLELLKNRTVDLLLTGTPSQYDARMLAVEGDAKGVAIEISDSHNRTIPPRERVNIDSLISSEEKLTFNTSLYIFVNEVAAGDFSSSAQLTLRYL